MFMALIALRPSHGGTGTAPTVTGTTSARALYRGRWGHGDAVERVRTAAFQAASLARYNIYPV